MELCEGIKSDMVSVKEEILSELHSTVSSLLTTVSMLAEKIASIETSRTDVDGRVAVLEALQAALQSENAKLHFKLDTLETFSWRNNIL